MLTTIFQGVTLIEFSEEKILEEFRPGLEKYIVRVISPTIIMVDQQRSEELLKILKKRGYEPKVTDLTLAK